MATYQKLPSGKWRAQVRRGKFTGERRSHLNGDAEAWAKQIEVQAEHIAATGFQPVPDGYTVGELIDGYDLECNMGGRTKQATHAMLKRELGSILLKKLN